jgi:tetratricopeptide (TPR) repeat protein
MKILILTISLLSGLITAGSNPREANEAYNNGDYETAARLYREAIDQDPENAKLHFNLGNALMMMGENEQAVVAYQRFMELAESPEEKALSEYNIGHFEAIAEQWQQAANRFKQALILNPKDEDARYNYELALSKLQEQEQNQDQQNQPPEPSEEAKRLKALAESLVDQRRYNEALNLMKEGLKSDPTVAAFNDFIKRIENITQVNAN